MIGIKPLSSVKLFVTPWTIKSMEFSKPEYYSGSLSLLQGIFPTQGSNPGLPHCRRILYHLSHKGSPTLSDPLDCSLPGSSVHDYLGKNTRVGCHALLQGIFPTQGSNPGLLHCRWILYQLSHKGSPLCQIAIK